ncbi:hemerythrin domain-containing protein [Sphingomonas sp. PAMC 26605]|uniref:hemerythrin domain-containing protein n=1 Tax=Sphingomonas sp. PAMC 26605 TaxID=1112214 RepID=UPI00026CD6D6|nr:hemerythrin domain-containing protein [Sphingomonas sp. PAMC 26605]
MTPLPAAMQLAERTGLPDDIAYLRAAYPAPQWRAHRNYGDLTAFWLQVHASLRSEAQRVAQTTRAFREGGGRIGREAFQRTFVPGFNHFLQHLTAHHGIEDQAYFPKFRALDPRMSAAFDVLESDHRMIHASLEATLDDARALLGALGEPGDPRAALDRYADTSERLFALLGQHLADEEEIVIPAMLEHGERSVS